MTPKRKPGTKRVTGRAPAPPARVTQSLLSSDDLHLFNEGTHYRLHRHLGAHPRRVGSTEGVSFAVWAPDAGSVSVIGDFNDWKPEANPLEPRDSSGIWEGFVPEARRGARYKYRVAARKADQVFEKADPFAFRSEVPPKTASVVWDLDYAWGDGQWIEERSARQSLGEPMSIYELHLGSWRRVPEDNNRSLTYRELAPRLAEYLTGLGFTHVELLPVMEHPFYGSWGYQCTGYFAPTSRYGEPQDLMFLIDTLHKAGIGVILDWVPSHFPTDGHGLGMFDGTSLYEHADPRKGFHPDWDTLIFNYGRNEVRAFLISSALFWMEHYHADALRVDAVASMLYLDYSREEGEWIPNEHGGRENLQAIDFLRKLNTETYGAFPGTHTVAEESTAWPMVSRPVYLGGLGFGLKWDMGWMHDTLQYFQRDPVHRSYHHNDITFRMVYAFNENFVLALSHDEVVHGKGSLLSKMPGDDWQKLANLRLLLAYMYAQPGKKLLFMGCEIGQWAEWNHDGSLEWHLLEIPSHRGVQRLVTDLNGVYRNEPSLHQLDLEPGGFEWIDSTDSANCVLSFLRRGREETGPVAIVLNFTPVLRRNYRIGVPAEGTWVEILNTDAEDYGGSGQGNMGGVETAPVPYHGRPASLNLNLPPLGAVFLRHEGRR